jgi:hypothetical protein
MDNPRACIYTWLIMIHTDKLFLGVNIAVMVTARLA